MTISPPMMPDIAAMMTATTTVWTATPPRRLPAKIAMASNRSSAIPAFSSSDAISTNSGTATSG